VTLGTSLALVGVLTLPPLSANNAPVVEHTGFGDVYATSFFDKSYSVPIMMAGLAVVASSAAVFTTMTAGTGAPAALAGVGATAAWVGGNVPGAYMIGLSTVGGFFGGNAVLGAAILNGAAAALIATTGGSIVGVTIAGTAYLVDGFNYVKKQETEELVFLTTLKLAPETGSSATQDAVERMMSLESEVIELAEEVASKELDIATETASLRVLQPKLGERALGVHRLAYEIKDLRLEQEIRVSQLQSLKSNQVEALERILEGGSHRQGDILALSLIAWNEHRYDLFQRAIAALSPADVDDTSFYHYLKALSAVSVGDLQGAERELANSMLAGPYALEPVALRAILLGEDFERNEHRLDELAFFAQHHFDANHYKTGLKLPSLYFRLGSIYFQNERYEQAKEYFARAHGELGIMQRSSLIGSVGLGDQELSHLIQANIANADYMLGNIEAADALMEEITKRLDEQEAAAVMGLYEGSFHD
jgi:tetratricopeptide (TPR) repeat protein